MIHFKYIWAGRRDLLLTAQKAELKVVGVLDVRTWGGAGVSVLSSFAIYLPRKRELVSLL